MNFLNVARATIVSAMISHSTQYEDYLRYMILSGKKMKEKKLKHTRIQIPPHSQYLNNYGSVFKPTMIH